MRVIKYVILLISITILCFSVYSLYKIKDEHKKNDDLKQELIEEINIPDIPSEETKFTVDFEKLKNINSDVVGWIIMEGTQVNYPIVQGENNFYYLNHSYEKKYSSFGSIFLDYSSSSDLSDKNSFIYGHHTRNGSMFGELKKYMNTNFFNEHPSFYLYTPNGNYKADIFSVYTADALSDSYNQSFSSLEDFKLYIDLIKRKSRFAIDVDVNYETDKIISLYSCSHESESEYERYFIHAVLRII